jgi:predicted nucleic acid-binding protein
MNRLRRNVLLDTGPLLALLNSQDQYHAWIVGELSSIAAPLLTCEPVMTECDYLLQRKIGQTDALWKLLDRGFIVLGFSLAENYESVQKLTEKYADTPMSLADACLVRMSEQVEQSSVLTLDGDFRGYRRHGKSRIPLIIPPDR